MRPRLFSTSRGVPEEVDLGSTGLTIGRDVSNTVRLEDPIVSSKHCTIDLEDGVFSVTDQLSTNGTFVNGKAITRQTLHHGDEIQVGRMRFYFLVEEGVASQRPAYVEDGEQMLSQTIHLNPLDSVYHRAVSGSSPERLSSDMSVLLRLSDRVHRILDSSELQSVLLEEVFERIPAENGAILLGTTLDQLLSDSVVSRSSPPGLPLRVSRTTVRQVFESGESILRNDLGVEDVSESIRSSNLQSLLCVPLTVGDTTTGVLYLATSNPSAPFDRGHLELATAIAGIAAVALEHARYVEWLETENRQLTHVADLSHGMVGECRKMKDVYEAIARVAPTDSPVLILGESGTGKELAARAIHNNSQRCNGPFVAVNCGSIVETLFASQLFGHAKGAFTGADRDQKGFIEEADGGTLFLDELADLPLHCQAALLRVLDEGKIRRVGSTGEIDVNVRLVSATNKPLAEEIRAGNFRSDLFFRMGLTIKLPPLRERQEDIPLLAKFFLQKYKSSTQREIGVTPPDTIGVLQRYGWPGNVRELGSAIRWAVVFGKSERIRPEDLPPEILKSATGPPVHSLEHALEAHERQLIIKALEETRGNVVEGARLLGRAPNYLQRRISQLKLRPELEKIRKSAAGS